MHRKILAVLILALTASYTAYASTDLVIPASTITQNASFIPAEVDGTKIEVIAVRDSQGSIRTAYNTCQVCYGSETAYYKQSGNFLVCQNCGNRFSMNHVGIKSGGCNPYPITESDRTLSADSIIIPYESLVKAKVIFSGWRIEY